MEHLVEQLFPRFGGKPVEGKAGRIGEGGAEAQNILKLFSGIERDGLWGKRFRGWPP